MNNTSGVLDEEVEKVTGGRIVFTKEEKTKVLVWTITMMKHDGSSRAQVIAYWDKQGNDRFIQDLGFTRPEFLDFVGETYDKV